MLATREESRILERVIGADDGDLPPEIARGWLRLGFTESDHERMAELSQKAQEASLSSAERAELEGYINVSHFIALLHSKARLSLRQRGQSA